jgi:uncharacterized protein YndB with AHSA1/START domain
MSAPPRAPGDQARVSVLVEVPPQVAFEVFTEDIDRWWRRGLRYRVAGQRRGVVHLEPRLGGRLYESFETATGTTIVETGRIRSWEPPHLLRFDWRAANFVEGELTEVEVTFAASASGTLVTVTHRGWTGIRADHPVRHGQAVGPFLRTMGLWWRDLLESLRLYAATEADGRERLSRPSD